MKRWTFEATYKARDGFINEARTFEARTQGSAWRKAAAWANRDLPGAWVVLSLALIGKDD